MKTTDSNWNKLTSFVKKLWPFFRTLFSRRNLALNELTDYRDAQFISYLET